MRSLATPRATTTQPAVLVRWLPTRAVTTTRPRVFRRSLIIRPVQTTLPWAATPERTSPQGATILISARRLAAEANTIRIGKSGTQNKTFIAGISGKIVAGGVGVIINATGQLGTVVSSARFKEAIKPMDRASETILALKPVTFRYKEELDPDKIPQFGLIAEEVEKINPDLVVRGEDGKVMTV